ncbi:amidophosphoribosyltransferase [bacterium]|nr:amidophosphoribosyltransferase [bacterium]
MCGIVGLVASTPVAQDIYDALTVLQHRGQDAAGIITDDGGRLYLRKENGLVRDVFSQDNMIGLLGNMGIGHVRYPTAGCDSSAEAQPFYVNSPFGISLAHNGNLTNSEALKRELFIQDRRHINTESDSEILLNVFAHELLESGKYTIDGDDIFEAISRVHARVRGAYAAVLMINGVGVVGFRDPHGIRPCVFGKRETGAGTDYAVASESVALDSLGFELIDDLEPGEAVFLPINGEVQRRLCAPGASHATCLFEYVYLARPDSVIDDVYVYKARLRMGHHLAEKIKRDWADHDIDVVIPIPDTSRTAALQLANELDVPFREGFIKNRYIGRTFIMPGQAQRKKSVRQKLNPIDLEFKDKNVLLVDDSIVRGTTSREIIQMARDSGARKVYFASAAPPVRFPNVYGIDMPSASELIAHGRTVEELERLLGADKLIYQELDDLIEAVRYGNPNLTRFDASVFNGEYVTQDVDADYLNQLELFRSDAAKSQRNSGGRRVVELHNTA